MAGKAFVSINSGGLPLKPEEIVKGQLIDLTSALPDADDQARRVLNVWDGIQDDLGPEAFDAFLRSVDFIERRMPQSSDYSIQLMEHIRRQYPGQAGVRWATDLLLQYRSAFRWIREENNAEIADGVHASLRRLQLLKWDRWRAYAMLLRMKSNPADLHNRIDTLDRICFALTVSMPDPRRLAEMMGRRIERFARGSFGKQAGFTFTTAQNERLIRNLSGPITESPRRSTIMRWIEAAMHGERVPRSRSDGRLASAPLNRCKPHAVDRLGGRVYRPRPHALRIRFEGRTSRDGVERRPPTDHAADVHIGCSDCLAAHKVAPGQHLLLGAHGTITRSEARYPSARAVTACSIGPAANSVKRS